MGRGQPRTSDKRLTSVAVVVNQVDYPMFEVEQVSKDGVRLRGPLVLERGEAVKLRLLFGDGSTMEASATIESVSLGQDSGVEVRFTNPSDRDRIIRKLA